MSGTLPAPAAMPVPVRSGWFPLPGFEPDAVPFALRTALALLLAYGVAFAVQLASATSAGLCVAIVVQASPGMAASKAAWRITGTLIGGVAAVAVVALFPQDRTMLLTGFTLWLGACTFVATTLRDFRAYGAVLSGYTVGTIAIGNIDAPGGVFLAALNAVAAILIGVVSVLAVNRLLAPPAAHRAMREHLHDWRGRIEGWADDALAGRPALDATDLVTAGAAVLALRTEAGYAAFELPGGRGRRQAAAAVIASMLGVLSATRGLSELDRHPPGPGRGMFGAERVAQMSLQRALLADALEALDGGRRPREVVRLGLYADLVGAWLNALRTMAAVMAGAMFCVIAGWPGATLLLIQQSAFTALLGMQPNPTAGAVAFARVLPVSAAAAFVVSFLWLPQASGFVLFSLAMGAFAFAFALVVRHRTLARYGPGLLLYLTLLVAPANTEAFDLGAFTESAFVQLVAIVFMALAFWLVLPVSPRRRLMRVADAVGADLRRALEGRARMRPIATARSLRYDRLAAVQAWLGRRTPARLAVLERLGRFAQLEGALLRAAHGLQELGRPMPPPEPGAFDRAVEEILAEEPSRPGAELAVSGLFEGAWLLRMELRALRRYGVLPSGGVAGHVA